MRGITVLLLFLGVAMARPEKQWFFDEKQISKLRSSRPSSAPVDFDCAAREVAYSYAKKIQPWRTNFEDVWDALELTTLCNQTKEYTKQMEQEKFPRLEVTSANTFFVATSGNDNNQGTLQSPWKSIQRAVRAARAANGNSTIYLRAGEYFLSETLRLTPDDNELTISNYQNEAVTVSGGTLLQTNWKPYKISEPQIKLYPNMNNVAYLVDTYGDTESIRYLGTFNTAAQCQAACVAYKNPPCQSFTHHGTNLNNAYAGQCFAIIDYMWGPEYQQNVTSGRITGFNIYVADLSGQNIKDITGLQRPNGGKRASRVRYPHADTETSHFPYGWMMETSSYLPGKKYPPAQTLLVDTPVRSDNLEFQLYSLGLGGPCSIFTPPESYWCSSNSSGGAATIFETPSGIVYEPWTFIDYPAPSQPQKGVMQMFHPYHWASWMYQVDEINPATQTITWSYGGFQGARGSGSGNGNGGEWYLENIFEFLDTQNEFYYDSDNQLLYYYYNGTTAPPSDFQLVATNLKTLIEIQGSQDDPVMNVTLQGIKFTGAAYTYMDPHGVPSGGDWAMQRIGAVSCEGCESFKVIGCRFERLDGNGLLLSGYNRHVEVMYSEFAWLGDSSIVLWGYSRGVDGTDGNQPRFTSIVGNVMREMGIFEKQSSGLFQAISCQTYISENLVFNGPRALVNFNDGFGGGNEIVNNLLFNPNRETSDQGPFNSWDRLPFLTDVDNGVFSYRPLYNNIHNNMFICNYGSNMCIDNDDGSSYYMNHHNVEIYGGHKSDFGGHNKYTYNTIALYAQDYADGLCGWFNAVVPDFTDGYYSNICVQGVAQAYLIFDECNASKPNAAVMPQVSTNSVYNAFGNLTVDCGGTILTIEEFQNLGFDQGTQLYPMPTNDQMMNWIKNLLEL